MCVNVPSYLFINLASHLLALPMHITYTTSGIVTGSIKFSLILWARLKIFLSMAGVYCMLVITNLCFQFFNDNKKLVF